MIQNNTDVGNWIETNEVSGASIIYPEKGNSYNLTVEPNAWKLVVFREPLKKDFDKYKEVGYEEKLDSHFDPSVTVELIKVTEEAEDED